MATSKKAAEKQEEQDVQVGIPNIENLKALLEQHAHIHVLFVNEAGEWFFQARPGFKAYERDEILNG